MTDATETQETDHAATPQAAAEATPEPADPTAAIPDDVAPPLAALIASIRAAVAKGASAEARAAGAAACRTFLKVLEAKPGEPLASEPQRPDSPASPLIALFKQPGVLDRLAGMSRDQLLDLLKQVTSMPASQQTPSSGPRFHLIQLPPLRRPGGK